MACKITDALMHYPDGDVLFDTCWCKPFLRRLVRCNPCVFLMLCALGCRPGGAPGLHIYAHALQPILRDMGRSRSSVVISLAYGCLQLQIHLAKHCATSLRVETQRLATPYETPGNTSVCICAGETNSHKHFNLGTCLLTRFWCSRVGAFKLWSSQRRAN